MKGEWNMLFRDVPIVVVGEYHPATPARFYYPDGSGHPGDPAELEIDHIFVEGDNEDIYNLFCELYIDEITDRLIMLLEEEYGADL